MANIGYDEAYRAERYRQIEANIEASKAEQAKLEESLKQYAPAKKSRASKSEES